MTPTVADTAARRQHSPAQPAAAHPSAHAAVVSRWPLRTSPSSRSAWPPQIESSTFLHLDWIGAMPLPIGTSRKLTCWAKVGSDQSMQFSISSKWLHPTFLPDNDHQNLHPHFEIAHQNGFRSIRKLAQGAGATACLGHRHQQCGVQELRNLRSGIGRSQEASAGQEEGGGQEEVGTLGSSLHQRPS